MRRKLIFGGLLCSLSLWGIGTVAVAAESPASALAQARLERATAKLDAMVASGKLPQDMVKYLPALRDILTRFCLNPDSLTLTERAIGRRVIQSRGDDIDQMVDDLEKKIQKMPGVKSKPEFIAGERRVPGGKAIGFVDIKIGEKRTTVLEIPSAIPGWTVGQRAAAVCKRMQATQQNNEIWWTRISPAVKREDYVVAEPEAPAGYIVTADKSSARVYGVTQAELAAQIVSDVRGTFDPYAKRALPSPMMAAVWKRQSGDKAYAANDPLKAEQDYLESIKIQNEYLPPYERLAELYYSRNQPDQAHQMLQRALTLKGLEPDQVDELKQMLNRSR